MRKTILINGLILGIILFFSVTSIYSSSLERLEPESGAYFGIVLDTENNDTMANFIERTGIVPSVWVGFFNFPFDTATSGYLENLLLSAKNYNGMVLLTIEPMGGLDQITQEMAHDLAVRLAKYEAYDVKIFVRFGHEMNGAWYPWGQKPVLYKNKFRMISNEIHQLTKYVAMMWAPNNACGYPYVGGKYGAKPGTEDYIELDTNKDGVLSDEDDPYTPYYPGDDVVDWIGMSIYHWGNAYPWGANNIPEEGKFISLLRGVYKGLCGKQSDKYDFYAMFADGHNKPLGITETGALYNTSEEGAKEFDIKRSWWRQVYNIQTLKKEFPRIKMINWFEQKKSEKEVKRVVDWTVTFNPNIAESFVSYLPKEYLIFATDLLY